MAEGVCVVDKEDRRPKRNRRARNLLKLAQSAHLPSPYGSYRNNMQHTNTVIPAIKHHSPDSAREHVEEQRKERTLSGGS
jgi:hypothetical protein